MDWAAENHANAFSHFVDVNFFRIDIDIFIHDFSSTRELAMPSFIRFSERKYVDLPQPEGPIKAVILFFSNCNQHL